MPISLRSKSHDPGQLDSETRFFTPPAYSATGERETTSNTSLDKWYEGWEEVEDVPDDVMDNGSDDEQSCATLRCLQQWLPFGSRRNIWEASRTDLYQAKVIEEAKYPKILVILQSFYLELIFVLSSLFSVALLFFSEAFLLESRRVWGVILLNNVVYIHCMFAAWVEVLITSKFSLTKRGYSKAWLVMDVLSVMPLDLLSFFVYDLNESMDDVKKNAVVYWLTVSRLTYFFRLRIVCFYMSKWEEEITIGEFKMFFFKILIYVTLLVHMIGCLFHRGACMPFIEAHLQLEKNVTITDACRSDSWVSRLRFANIGVARNTESPLLKHKWMNVIWEHYLVSMYWGVVTLFRIGSSWDIMPSWVNISETAFSSLTQILVWIFLVAYVGGSLTSLFLESDTENENFLNRRVAINQYLNFNDISDEVKSKVNLYYDYLWVRNKGFHIEHMMDQMPLSLRAEILYDINKYVLDQLPLFANLDEAFLMSLGVHVKHRLLMKDEVVQKKGKNGNAMYFVINGFLEIMHGDGTNVLIEVRSGSVIGEQFLLYPLPAAATVRAGTESDVMVLHREDYKQVLTAYPENKPIIMKRFETRKEQFGLLLALLERHNQYTKAFNKLCEPLVPTKEDDNAFFKQSYEKPGFAGQPFQIPEEGSDILITGEKKVRYQWNNDRRLRRSYINDLSAVSFAIEKDVARSCGLAADLDMPKPPLFVRAPKSLVHKKIVAVSEEKTPFAFIHLSSNIIISGSSHTDAWKLWKFLVIISINFVFFYHPYRMAFGDRTQNPLDYFSHICDIIFLFDFVMDMSRPVVLPHRTLEDRGDIFSYNVHTFYFWIRLFAFLPIEYPLAHLARIKTTNELFFIFKFNRLMTYPEQIKFFSLFEDSDLISQKFLFLFRFFIRLFHLVHVFAILFEALLNLVEKPCVKNKPNSHKECIPILDFPEDRYYGYTFYWATQAVTATGFGDFYLRDDLEIAITVVALFCGCAWLMYLGCKMAAITANKDKKKVMFKQLYYSIQTFLKDRAIPEGLMQRVMDYYKLQWYQNQGVLLPHDGEYSAIADAPESIVKVASLAQANGYVESIPLFRHVNDKGLIEDICTALRLYTVPPSEKLQHPNSCTRELYIIVKGYCKVTRNRKLMGKLGPGNYFGLSGLIYGMNPYLHVETINSCQIFCLEFNKFLEIAQRHPDFMNEFKILRGDAARIPKNFRFNLDPKKEWEIFSPPGGDPRPSITLSLSSLKPFLSSNEVSLDERVAQPNRFKRFKSTLHKLFVAPILPYGTALKRWTIFRTFCAFLIGNFVPPQAAFSDNPKFSLIVVLIFDILAWFDMTICSRVAYYGPDNQLITSFKKTAVHYLKGPFVLDFLGSFPFDLLIIMFDPKIHPFAENPTYNNNYAVISLLRMTRLIQCYRLFVFQRHTSKGIFKSLSLVVLLEAAPLMALFLNVIACTSLLVVCGPSSDGEDINCYSQPRAWIHDVNGFIFENSWYSPYNMLENYPITAHIIAIYWTLSSALNIGFGDLQVIQDAASRNSAIAIILIGVVFTGFVISQVAACQMLEDPRRIKVREMTNVISKRLDDYGIPENLKRRAQEYCDGAWDKTKGIYPTDLFPALHPSLRADVQMALFEERLRQCPLFSNLEESGIIMLCTMLEEVFYPEGEFVFEYGDLCGDVYLVAKGLIAIYTDRKTITSYVGNGSLIGEISCLFGVQRQYTAVASADSEVFMFRKPDFLKFLSFFPNLKKNLEQSCLQHFRETLHTSAEHPNLLRAGSRGGTSTSLDSEVEEDPLISDMEGILDFEDLQRHAPKYDEILLRRHKTPSESSILSGRRSIVKKSSLAILEMDLGSAKEMTPSECDNVQGFIEDPLRVAAKEYEIPKRRARNRSSGPGGVVDEGEAEEMDKHRIHQHTKRWHNSLVSYGNVPMSEMGLVHIVQERDKVSFCCGRFTIHPMSPVCTCVSLYLIITTLSCAFTAYEIAFHNVDDLDEHFAVRILMELFFAIRIFGNFFQGYYTVKGILVTDTKLITKRYLRNRKGFFLDFITTFPFYLISYTIGKEGDVARDLRSFQLLRIFLYAHYLRKVETGLRTRLTRIKIIKIGTLLFFIFHFTACGWYLVACHDYICRTGSWMNILLSDLIGEERIKNATQEIKAEARYFLSLSYVTTAITFNGLADISARTQVELVMTIGMSFFTVFVVAFLLGETTQCISSQLKSKIHFRHKLDQLVNHFKSLNLSRSKMESVRKYFQVIWSRTNAQPFTKLLEVLPYPLRADITYKIYGENICNSRVFATLNKTIVRQLSTRVKHEIYLPGSYIVRSGHICTAIYFIKKGEVVIIDDSGGLDLCVDILHENECFGEVKVLLPQKEGFHFSYVSRLETEIGVLSSDDLTDVLGRYKSVLAHYINRAVLVRDKDSQRKDEDDSTLDLLIDLMNKPGGTRSLSLGGTQSRKSKASSLGSKSKITLEGNLNSKERSGTMSQSTGSTPPNESKATIASSHTVVGAGGGATSVISVPPPPETQSENISVVKSNESRWSRITKRK